MSKEKFKPEIEHKDPEGLATLTGMYQEYFLDYASYVILERAVPHINDGLKPVQRRILHAMKEMDDGRYHKVANIIGQTMQFHPHGDAAIGDALVNLGQKDLLIDCQGNWGDIRTGDSAAAPRYIEARLTKFALDVAFNAQTTHWQLSYDGRKKEPITLPMKFPLVLAQGVEGIAVGLATKILPHNFIELIKASIKVLQGKKATIYPDFQNGGMIDVSEYNDGLRGGRVKVRAKIEQVDKSTLMITQLPYGVTTSSMIDSIIKATEKGQIKVKKVVDNTAKNVEIVMDLMPGTSPDITIDALYAFTECEVSISPNACVIVDDKPRFLGVSELLRISTEQTKSLLEWELNIKKSELEEKWHLASLEKIFIENRIYHDIEECETWEAVIETIDAGLRKYVVTPSEKAKASDKRVRLMRELTEEDITKLTEIRIKRISKYNSFKADEYILGVEEDLKQVAFDLENLTDFAIAYFERLLEKYGKGKERKTEITSIEQIQVQQVVANNAKLYVNFKDGFVGMGMKKDDFVCDCSDIDDVIAFTRDGKFKVVRIADKVFVGKDIIHVAVWKKGDERTTYNLVYVDGKTGTTYAKRFNVTAITRDKEYDLTKDGSKGSKVLYFTMQPNGESEVLNITLTPASTARIKVFDYDLSEIAIKGRSSQGNIVTKYPVRKVTQVSVGQSSLGAMKVYIDDVSGRLNTDGRGRLLGAFDTGEKLIALYKDGSYELSELDLTRKFDVNAIETCCRSTQKTWSSVPSTTRAKKAGPWSNDLRSRPIPWHRSFTSFRRALPPSCILLPPIPAHCIKITYKNGGQKEEYEFMLDEFIDIKGWKALGNKLFEGKMMKVEELSYNQPAEPQDHSPVQGDLFGGKGGDKGGKLKSGDTVEW
jgi:topoisomerase-4 subunit A